jgi:hypothetical protein
MKVISETCRAEKILYLRFHYTKRRNQHQIPVAQKDIIKSPKRDLLFLLRFLLLLLSYFTIETKQEIIKIF